MRTAEWTESVSVLDRVTAILEAFGEDDDGLGVSELARRANLPKSTVSRIAADLVVQRFLDRDGDKLYLGLRLFELGQTVEKPRRLRHSALPVMRDLRNLTGGTVHLAVLEGPDVVFIAIVRGQPSQKPAGRVGTRLPAHATALGKALLAFSTHEVTAPFLEECVAGRACVASPILGHGALPVAAISVTAAAAEFDSERAAPVVRAAAVTIGRRLTVGRTH